MGAVLIVEPDGLDVDSGGALAKGGEDGLGELGQAGRTGVGGKDVERAAGVFIG